MKLEPDKLYDVIKQALIEELSGSKNHTARPNSVPVGVSARHVHLCQADVEALFGNGYQLTKHRDILQPGQYASNEKVTIQGPKGEIANVRILGPTRLHSQVEISRTDGRKIGAHPPVRRSGDIAGSAPITLIGPKGKVVLTEGCIIAERHIHMSNQDAAAFSVTDGQLVAVKVTGVKGGVMGNVSVRVSDKYTLEMHIDTDDANAFGLSDGEYVEVIPAASIGGL